MSDEARQGEPPTLRDTGLGPPSRQLHIDQVFTDAGQLIVTVEGADPERELHVAAQVLVPGRPGVDLADHVVIFGDAKVAFNLAGLEIRAVAWTPDVSATPAVRNRVVHWS